MIGPSASDFGRLGARATAMPPTLPVACPNAATSTCLCAIGAVGATLDLLKASPKTAQAKAKIVLATDGACCRLGHPYAKGQAIWQGLPRNLTCPLFLR